MNIEVRFFSRSGNTKKVAEAVANAVGAEAKDCSEPLTEPVDLLFLGGSVYGGGLDGNLKQFIEQLDASTVKRAAVFSTSAIVKTPEKEAEGLLRDRGIPVSSHSFHCRGSFLIMHKGRPNDEDLSGAAAFAVSAADEAKLSADG
ncbi:MAG: flavodoxin [Clostridiales Family XIII bacterium]|jgi:flavodoxin|nr:flavodoxin [Clostridiales Family XIII bacterium]